MHLAQGRARSTYKGIARALLLCAERPLRGDGQAQESRLGSRLRLHWKRPLRPPRCPAGAAWEEA